MTLLDERRAESIVRTLHGKVPGWASGAVVHRDRPADAPPEPSVYMEDATFEAVGHTGILSCDTQPDGQVTFKAVRRPSRQAIRKYGVPTYPHMLEIVQTLTREYIDECRRYGLGRGRLPKLGDTTMMIGAQIGDDCISLACIIGKGGPTRFPLRERNPMFGAKGLGRIVGNFESLFATVALMRRYEWHVAMRIDGAPALTFACTPGSARAAFRLRDLPPGKSRRDALLHWVCEHYRNPQIHVSEHLRGKHVFSWRGIECEIVPSAFDREKEITRKQSRRLSA